MRTLYIALTIVLIPLCYGRIPPLGEPNPRQLMNDLQNAASQKNLLVMKPEHFNRYIMAAKRPYNAIVMFTITSERCPFCRQALSEYLRVGNEWHAAQPPKNRKKTFFVIVDGQGEGALELFQSLGVETVPTLAYIRPSSDPSPKLLTRFDFKTTQWSGQNLNMWVSKMCGYTVEVAAQPAVAGTGISGIFNSGVVGFAVMLLVFVGVYGIVRTAWKVYSDPSTLKKPIFWFIIALIPYCLSLGGVFFDFIHSPPLFYPLQNGQVMLFYSQHGRQFVIEGIIMLVVLLTGMASFLGLTQYVPNVKHGLGRKVSFYGLLSIIFAVILWVSAIFMSKMPGYLHGLGLCSSLGICL